MKRIIFLLFISTTVFAQTPRLKFRQIQKDTTQGSIAISNPADSQLVFSRDFYISYGVDTVLILYGDTVGVGATLDAEQVQDIVGAMVNAGLGLDVTYNDVDGELLLESLSIEDSVKNETASTILKGTPLYAVTTVGNYWSVAPADATDPAKMPVVAIAGEELIAGATGIGLILGHITGVNVPTSWSAGDEVWVGANGTFINHEPATEDTLIQRLGSVIKTGTNGSGIISIGDVNKNLNNGNIFIGDATGKVTTTQYIVDSTRLNATGDTAFYYQNGVLIGSQEIAGGGGTSYNNISETADTVFIDKYLNVDTSTLYVDATNNRVGIGTIPNSEAGQNVNWRYTFDALTPSSTNVVQGSRIYGANNYYIRHDIKNTITGSTNLGGAGISLITEGTQADFTSFSVNSTDTTRAGRTMLATASSNSAGILFRTTGNHDIEFTAYSDGSTTPDMVISGNNVGIGTSTPLATLDISSGYQLGDIKLGGNVDANTRTDDTRKIGRIVGSHYDNNDEDILMFSYDSDGTNNILSFGGGAGALNAATKIGFVTASSPTTTTGSGRMLIDNNGNVGIGTSSPQAPLTIAGPVNIIDPDTLNGSDANLFIYSINDINSTNGATDAEFAFYVAKRNSTSNSAGPYFYLTGNDFTRNAGNRGRLLFAAGADLSSPTSNDGTVQFLTNGGSLTIEYDGDVVIPRVYSNTTGTAANVNVDATGLLRRFSSSIRYKTNIRAYDKGISNVMQLNPIYYKGINDGDNVYAGFIAEEIDELGFTEFVQYDSEGKADAISYSNMTALLTKAIQEQQEQIEAIQTELDAKSLIIETQEQKITDLETTIQSLITRIENLENK